MDMYNTGNAAQEETSKALFVLRWLSFSLDCPEHISPISGGQCTLRLFAEACWGGNSDGGAAKRLNKLIKKEGSAL